MKQIAVQDIVAHVMDRLASGTYVPGGRLPTSRELADDLGAHRNTVAKAYKSLAELGMISAKPGRGTFVAAGVGHNGRRVYAQQASSRLADAILLARRGNLAEGELRRTVDELISTIYNASPAAAFVECNAEDLRVSIAEIEQQTGVGLAPLLLDAVAADPAGALAGFDVVFTSLFHLLEVRELAAGAASVAVVGLHTQPDERGLAEIAQIKPGTRVGIVVSNEDGARRFVTQIEMFSKASIQTLIRPSDDEVQRLDGEVDLIVMSRSRAAQVRRLALAVPATELSFHISLDSGNRVVEMLHGSSVTDRRSTEDAGDVTLLERRVSIQDR
jgi:DNA-binding transcriptional regulator YhcF (GntR family)